ncbi:hypothetical protein FHR81_005233 [Actinoalloteichus hoggarensis]|uniref:Uncharacterized protein n=1 Tax=Actinoalloteichus hoggarensis TaxID=1470176 RepID=A0A221WAI3_9PSEU|nr:glycohydrolase toxin TNT-related protein [Actinoalloteichus hoggarensis]ASO22701.1 hypothetical protein AHOG_25480 [Actinoalloteichus hoggarensis]MBB5924156.1 hypothetical protein [Actinoalloteichus hoggarensis]
MSRPTANSPEDQAVLARDIGMALLQAAPPGWQQIRVEYRAMGGFTDSVGKVISEDGSSSPWEPPADCGPLFERLRQNMYDPEKGTWLSALYVVERPSNYRIDVNLDKQVPWEPPLPPTAFEEELSRYPRPEKRIPPWFWHAMGRPERQPADFDRGEGGFPEDQFATPSRPDPSIRRQGHDDEAHTDYLPEMPSDGPVPGHGGAGANGAEFDRATGEDADFHPDRFDGAGQESYPAQQYSPEFDGDFPPQPESYLDENDYDYTDDDDVDQQAAPDFQLARVFDGTREDGRPLINRPSVDPGEREKLVGYLRTAPVVLSSQGLAADPFVSEGRPSVPISWHTDGFWIWPAAVGYHLARHGVPPMPELVEHIRAQEFRLPGVHQETRDAATDLLYQVLPDPRGERQNGTAVQASAAVPQPDVEDPYDSLASDVTGVLPAAVDLDDEPGRASTDVEASARQGRAGCPPSQDHVHEDLGVVDDRQAYSDGYYDEGYREQPGYQEEAGYPEEPGYQDGPGYQDTSAEEGRFGTAIGDAAGVREADVRDPHDGRGLRPGRTAADDLGQHGETGYAAEQDHPVERGYPEAQGYPEERGYAAGRGYPTEQDYPDERGLSGESDYSADQGYAGERGYSDDHDRYSDDHVDGRPGPAGDPAVEDHDGRPNASSRYADYPDEGRLGRDDIAEATEEVDQASLEQLRERLADLGVDESAYRIGGTEDDVWCLLREGRNWSVFWSEHGERYDEISFDQSNQACAYLLGALLMMHPSDAAYSPAPEEQPASRSREDRAFAEAEYAEPDYTGSDRPEPHYVGSDHSGSDYAGSDYTGPDYTQPDYADDIIADASSAEQTTGYREPAPAAEAPIIRPPRAMDDEEVADLFRNGGLVLPPSRPYADDHENDAYPAQAAYESPGAEAEPEYDQRQATDYAESAAGDHHARSAGYEPEQPAQTRAPSRPGGRRRAAERPAEHEPYEQRPASEANRPVYRDEPEHDGQDADNRQDDADYGRSVADYADPSDGYDRRRQPEPEQPRQEEPEYGRRAAAEFAQSTVIDHRRPAAEYARQGTADYAQQAGMEYAGTRDSADHGYDTRQMNAVEIDAELDDDRPAQRSAGTRDDYQPAAYQDAPYHQDTYQDAQYQSGGYDHGSYERDSYGGDDHHDGVIGSDGAAIPDVHDRRFDPDGRHDSYLDERPHGDQYQDDQYQDEDRYQDDRYQDGGRYQHDQYQDERDAGVRPDVAAELDAGLPPLQAGRRGAVDPEPRQPNGFDARSAEEHEPRQGGRRASAPEPGGPEDYEVGADLGTSPRRQASADQPVPAARPAQSAEQQSMVRPLPGEPPLTLFRERRLLMLQAGTEVDRFGDPNGNVTYAAGTPYSRRSLPPQWIKRGYHTYRLLRPLQVLTGIAVPWFEQPGGGVSYVLPRSITDLIEDGALAEMTDVEPPGVE